MYPLSPSPEPVLGTRRTRINHQRNSTDFTIIAKLVKFDPKTMCWVAWNEFEIWMCRRKVVFNVKLRQIEHLSLPRWIMFPSMEWHTVICTPMRYLESNAFSAVGYIWPVIYRTTGFVCPSNNWWAIKSLPHNKNIIWNPQSWSVEKGGERLWTRWV